VAQLINFQFEGWIGNLLVAAAGAVVILWLWRTLAPNRGY
jgi:uncharacterized membrane protein YeaQ/YmgE (transglycosylase-associated protein family)